MAPIALASYLLGCPGKTEVSKPDIILITIDTLRADRISYGGYERLTTPFLDELARSGVFFSNCYSTSSWTVPAVASLLVSLYPESHGTVSGAIRNGAIVGQQVLSSSFPRLPGVLKANGYTTYGITANGHLDASFGFSEGFDRYHNLGFGGQAPDVNRVLASWREEIQQHSPFFLWLHYFDPHAPYVPRSPWIEEYYSEEVTPSIERARFETVGIEAGSAELRYLQALYDGEVSFTDAAIRNALASKFDLDSALVLVTSDHGEEFLDHGRFGHNGTLFGELIRVPLIVKFPGSRFAGRVLDSRVSLVDILPSTLNAIGVPSRRHFQGESFLELLERRQAPSSRHILTSLARNNRVRVESLIEGDWKYLRYSGQRQEELLFRLDLDPKELQNLVTSHPDERQYLADRLRDVLSIYGEHTFEPETSEMTEEQVDELKALGYLD